MGTISRADSKEWSTRELLYGRRTDLLNAIFAWTASVVAIASFGKISDQASQDGHFSTTAFAHEQGNPSQVQDSQNQIIEQIANQEVNLDDLSVNSALNPFQTAGGFGGSSEACQDGYVSTPASLEEGENHLQLHNSRNQITEPIPYHSVSEIHSQQVDPNGLSLNLAARASETGDAVRVVDIESQTESAHFVKPTDYIGLLCGQLLNFVSAVAASPTQSNTSKMSGNSKILRVIVYASLVLDVAFWYYLFFLLGLKQCNVLKAAVRIGFTIAVFGTIAAAGLVLLPDKDNLWGTAVSFIIFLPAPISFLLCVRKKI